MSPLWPHGLHSPCNSLGQNTGVGSLSLLQGDLPNPGLPSCRWILYQLSHKGSPRILKWVAHPFSSRSSQSRNWTRVSCISGAFFTNWAIRETEKSRCTKILFYASQSELWFCYLQWANVHLIPGWLSSKESAWQFGRLGFHSWVGKIP